ncbi:MAG: BlaI/MecI/CopY family transcriptional regulator [Saccharofermentans sp.]|nr:BlaI/MecI/CopY family transcriptional regulator [Saccharofermentans sp.]
MIKLADTEWNIMELLWEKGPMTTMEITHELEESKGWTKSTVITLLKRMDNKGSIYFEAENKTKKYYPSIRRDEAELEETKTFLNKFYRGNIGLMISSLLNQEALTQDEIDELHRIIEKGSK